MVMLQQVTDIDLKLLQIFVAVAQSQGISAAQSRLQMNQSTISTHLATLETRLGFRLCERGRSGFALTPKGERILLACQTLFNSVRDFTKISRSLNGLLTGELRVGLVDNLATLPGNPFSQAVKQFLQRQQSVQLHCSICSPEEIEQKLLNHQLDVGIGYFGQQLGSLNYSDWLPETQAVYCSRTHPFYLQEKLSLQQIESASWVHRGYILAQDLCPVVPLKVGAVALHMESTAHMILTGEYLGYLPTHYAAQWLDEGELRQLGGEFLSYKAMLCLVTRQQEPNELLSALLENLQLFEEGAGGLFSPSEKSISRKNPRVDFN
jgi:LysR family transcriptional regulator, transcriptional activator for bauABCD operon